MGEDPTGPDRTSQHVTEPSPPADQLLPTAPELDAALALLQARTCSPAEAITLCQQDDPFVSRTLIERFKEDTAVLEAVVRVWSARYWQTGQTSAAEMVFATLFREEAAKPVLHLLPASWVATYRMSALIEGLSPEQVTMVWALVPSSTQSLAELRSAVRLLEA